MVAPLSPGKAKSSWIARKIELRASSGATALSSIGNPLLLRAAAESWLEGSYRARTGQLSYTKEETKVSILAVEGGALYRFMTGSVFPYAGAGLGFYIFDEKNVAIGEAKQNKIGFCGLAGVSWIVGGSFVLDARVKFSTCTMKPADFNINVGGITLGIGAGFRF